MPKPKKKPIYNLEELIDIVENLKYAGSGDIISSIVYELYEIRQSIENMDNEMRGYDP